MDKAQYRNASFPAIYTALYPILRDVASACGYALTVHGSMSRDLDLVAVPWVDNPASPETLVQNLAFSVGAFLEASPAPEKPTKMPGGRLNWLLLLEGGAYIDLNVVLPYLQNHE